MLKHRYEKEENYISESKKRCRELELDPNKIGIPQNIMSESELTKKKEEYKEILEVISFFSEKIIKSFEGTPIMIGISDEKGYVLDMLGDEKIVSITEQLLIKPGVQYIEEHVGTNVVTLTLEQNKPIQVIGADHYHVHLHKSACYGVPFHYPDNNKLLGTICIMTGVILHNPFFLMTLTTVVDAIERELLLRKQSRRIDRQRELLYKSEKKRREILENDIIMKDEFITLITHELKTPINVIYSAIQLIEHIHMDKIPESVRKLIGTIKLNTFRQLRIVNNLLDITRLNSNQFKLNLKNLDIVLLTKLITESVNIYAGQKDIKLSFETSIDSKNIMIDDEKYERIILNLLSNSIKFTTKGGSINVKVQENIDDNTIVIDVNDTGIGIPKEKYSKIFERFGQVDNNLSRRAEGSGIGLSLVKMLTDIMGGKILLDSEVSAGSTFTIVLPIEEGVGCESNGGYLDYDERLINTVDVEFSDIYF